MAVITWNVTRIIFCDVALIKPNYVHKHIKQAYVELTAFLSTLNFEMYFKSWQPKFIFAFATISNQTLYGWFILL